MCIRDSAGDLRLQLLAALEEVGEAREHLVEVAGELAGADHRDEQVVEQLRVLRERVAERLALVDGGPHLGQYGLEALVRHLLDERAERLRERDAALEQ